MGRLRTTVVDRLMRAGPDFRALLVASERPDRIFATTVAVVGKAGLIGRRRVLDSTPIYDTVTIQNTG